LTYAQASRLTIPQLMHALGIDPRAASQGQIAGQLIAAQHQMLDRIAARRGYFPLELSRMPMSDLIEQIKAESDGHAPAISLLPAILARYAAEAGF
jgi:hypothetical protein